MIKSITVFKIFLLVSIFFLMFNMKSKASEVNFSLIKTDSGSLVLNRSPVNFTNGLQLDNNLYLYKFVGLNKQQTTSIGKSTNLTPVVGLGLGNQKNGLGYGFVMNTDSAPMIGLTLDF